MTWKSYRHRFTPWILFNWQHRSHQPIKLVADETLLPSSFAADLLKYIGELHAALQQEFQSTKLPQEHLKASFSRSTKRLSELGEACMHKSLGFTIGRGESHVEKAGTGVLVKGGTIPKDRLVALYPGLIYEPGEPILLQSIRNQFVFRCHDGVLIDGNDRALSKFLFRSCAGREINGGHLMSDISWLTQHPINNLSIGQYINNQGPGFPANVEYHEIDLSAEFPAEYLKYIPNIHYSSTHQFGAHRCRRLVVLRSLREIQEGEELFSTYFTVVR